MTQENDQILHSSKLVCPQMEAYLPKARVMVLNRMLFKILPHRPAAQLQSTYRPIFVSN